MKFVMIFATLFLPALASAQATTCTLDVTDAMTQFFGIPAADVIAQAFALGFVTPATVYLAAYLVGCLVNFWNH